MIISIINFLRITKKKVIITLMFPFTAVLVLFSGFMLDEILRLGGRAIVNAIYSLENYLYFFIFLPLTFIDIDFTPSAVLKIAFVLTLIWWYILSCILVSLLERRWKK